MPSCEPLLILAGKSGERQFAATRTYGGEPQSVAGPRRVGVRSGVMPNGPELFPPHDQRVPSVRASVLECGVKHRFGFKHRRR